MFSLLSTSDFTLWIIAIVVLTGLGVALLVWGKRGVEQIHRARSWLQTTGTVNQTSMQKESRRTGGRGFLGARRTTYYKPIIDYTYSVIGMPYQSSRYRIPDGWMTPYKKVAEDIISRYPAGKQIEVRYDPEDPAEACLEISATGGWQAIRIMGWLLLAAAVLLFLCGANLIRQGLEMEAAKDTVSSSPAVLTVTKSQIQTGIERELGWSCPHNKTFFGIDVAYEGWTCRPSGSEGVLFVDIWNRRDDPEKVDLLWVVATSETLEGNQDKLATIAKLGLPQGDAQAAESWVLETLPQANLKGYKAETTISGIPLVIQRDNRLFLLIGKSK